MRARIIRLLEHIKGKLETTTADKAATEKLRTIMSLAPNDELAKDKHFLVYRDYLENAFSNPQIKNIALSGNWGAGKSSILRSFDKYINKGDEKFLFISLIDFENQQSLPSKTSGEKKNNDTPKEQPEQIEKKRLEDSLLCQILTRCRKKDLQEGSLLGVPEQPKKLGMALLCALAGSLAFVLIFHEHFAQLVTMLGMTDDHQRTMIHQLLYVAADILVFIALFIVTLKGKVTKVSLKSTHAETEVDLDNAQTPLDTHRFELIYALNKISRDIGYTVVFEDMDRIPKDVCIDIMTKLRELNMMVNVRKEKIQSPVDKLMSRVCCSRPPVRFVYAVDDRVFDQESRSKFYDCIIPVIPALNRFNSYAILMELLGNSGVNIKDEEIISVIKTSAPFLTNYRTVLSVRNEFVVLRDILQANNETTATGAVSHTWTDVRLISLAIFKTITPQTYSDIFHKAGNDIEDDEIAKDLLYEMFSDFLSDEQLLRRVGATDTQIRAAHLDTLVYGSEKNRWHAWEELLGYSGESLPYELIERRVFDYQNDPKLSEAIAEYIFNKQEDQFDWFFALDSNKRWQKFTNCMSYLANTGVGWKNQILEERNAEDLFRWFSQASADAILFVSDTKVLNANWTPAMCDILVDIIWENRDKIGRKTRSRTFLGTKSLNELILEREQTTTQV